MAGVISTRNYVPIQWDTVPKKPTAPTSPALEGLQGASGLPAYGGTVPLGQVVPAEQQYGAATQLALGAQGGQTQKDLQAAQAAAALRQQQDTQQATTAQQTAKYAAEQKAAQAQYAAQNAQQQSQQGSASSLQTQDLAAEQQRQAQAEAAAQQAEAQKAALAQQNWDARFGQVTNLAGGGGTGGGGATVQYPDYNDPNSPYAQARAAAFSRAKDQSGEVSRSALDSLQNLYSGTNRAGSGALLARQGEAIGGATDQLGSLNQEQLIQDLQAAQEQATQGYQGGITQRGQDLAYKQALLGLLNSGGAMY